VLERLNRHTEIDMEHPHSAISESLRLGVMECELYYKLNSDYMGAWASLNAHSGLNIKSALTSFNKLSKDVKATIPFTKYDATDDQMDDDLKRAIEVYKKMEKDRDNGGSE
jgi:hypothetical protein